MAQTSTPQSPWQPNQAQNQEAFMPPAKRQRLSPGPSSSPGSPYAHATTTPYANSSTYANISLPNGAFSNARANGVTPADGTQRQTMGAMGPPQRPAERAEQRTALQKEEKPTDVNDLNDLVATSGINLKDEEDFLNQSYRSGRTTGQHSHSTQQSSQSTSFDLLSQNKFGNLGASRSSFARERPKRTEEEELYEKHKKAARILNERAQYELNDPFLWGASVRQRMQAVARENVLSIPINGLWDRISDKPASMSGSSMKDFSGAGVQVTKAPSMLNSGTPMEPILCLLSLAANERIRGLLEDAYGLARGRQLGTDGVVPPEWSDIALGEGGMQVDVVPKAATQTAWEKQETPLTNGDHNSSPPAPGDSATPAKPGKLSTISFTDNKFNAALMALSARDRQAEEARLKARKERRERKAKAVASATTATATASPVDPGTPGASGKPLPSGMLGERAPEVKMTKKEREKASKQDINEEVAAREANITAAMQLGGKKYSWMSGGASKAKPAPKPAIPSRSGAAGGKEKKEGLAAIEDRRLGNWREDSGGGKGVQLRDWIAALEQDKYERKTLAWAYTRLDDPARKRLDTNPPHMQQHQQAMTQQGQGQGQQGQQQQYQQPRQTAQQAQTNGMRPAV